MDVYTEEYIGPVMLTYIPGEMVKIEVDENRLPYLDRSEAIEVIRFLSNYLSHTND